MWRQVHLLCANSIERANCFGNPPIRDSMQISCVLNAFKSSPVALQMCRRYANFNAMINNKYNLKYTLIHQPRFTRSSQNHIGRQFLNQQTLLQRSFASQYGSHKRTGSYSWDRANQTTMTYMAALAVAVVGVSYAAVPLYRIFCQASGYGGTVSVVDPSEKVESMEPLRERELTIRWVARNGGCT